MIIGHIPAAYILTRKLQDSFSETRYMMVGLAASILPDIDLLYSYVSGDKQSHHNFWIHRPFDWAVIALGIFLVVRLTNWNKYRTLFVFFFSNIFLHLCLDTISGKIKWLYPFSERGISLFYVKTVHEFWVLDLVFHWTFIFEIIVVLFALKVFRKSKGYSYAYNILKSII